MSEVDRVPRKWEKFDAELRAACFRFATGDTLRKLKMYRSSQLKAQRDMSGRAALWMIMRKYTVDAGALHRVGLSQLMNHSYSGDLGLYLDGLDKILGDL